ncbi:MAG: hypothetical protein K0B01_14665 [Syntrophobacterales bacterium]|nr:hypothetical protein [Syntrophobacterales bacterium]
MHMSTLLSTHTNGLLLITPRTLKTMARYGIVRMEKVHRNIRPVVEATDFTVQFGLYGSSRSEQCVNTAKN